VPKMVGRRVSGIRFLSVLQLIYVCLQVLSIYWKAFQALDPQVEPEQVSISPA